MKPLSQTLTLAGLSLLLVLTASSHAQAGNDTLRMTTRVNLPTAQTNPTRLLTQPLSPAYFSNLMHRPTPKLHLYLPPLHSRLLPQWIPLGPAGMPVQDFVFTRFTLAKPAKRR